MQSSSGKVNLFNRHERMDLDIMICMFAVLYSFFFFLLESSRQSKFPSSKQNNGFYMNVFQNTVEQNTSVYLSNALISMCLFCFLNSVVLPCTV